MSYEYRHVELVRVVDGDTVRLDIDLGNHLWWIDSFRLAGIDTPERGQPGYQDATLHLIALLGARLCRVQTHAPDKYGRWLATLYTPGPEGGEVNVNEMMIASGHAKPYDGGKKE